MTKRQQNKKKIADKIEKIKALKNEINKLQKENLLLSDDVQRFEEKIERHKREKWARNEHPYNNKLIGRIFWNEDFRDEDTGEVITIERQQVVRVEGKWVV